MKSTRAGPVVIRRLDGTVVTMPPYDPAELKRIIEEGDEVYARLYATGQLPDLKGTGYVPGTHEDD